MDWPPRLLIVVKEHMEAVESVDSPMIPPLLAPGGMTIYDFFLTHHDTFVSRLAERGVDADMVEFTIGFAIEVLEHACQLSFLMPKERRTVGLAVRQVEKRTTGPKPRGSGAGGGDGRRKRGGQDSREEGEDAAKYCRVLSLEYLLRFFVALPMILDHYDKLGGSAIPAFSRRPLWEFANEALRLMDASRDKFYPLHTYTSVK